MHASVFSQLLKLCDSVVLERHETVGRSVRGVALVVALALCLATSASAQTTYTIADLGALNGGTSVGYSINNSGQVTGRASIVGNYPSDTAVTHAFVISPPYIAGSMVDLGTLGGYSSEGLGINNSGQVAGFANLSDSNTHAFVISPPYSAGSMTDLGTLGGVASFGQGINASGQVTGYSYLSGNANGHAFLISSPYTAGSMIDLGTLGGTNSAAMGINDAGQVTGQADVDNTTVHAFLISSPYTVGSMTDLGTLNGNNTYGAVINASGQVAGSANFDASHSNSRGFLISSPYTAMTDLGTLGGTNSYALGIGASGQVTGVAYTSTSQLHAFLYTAAGMVDLNTLLPSGSGWILTFANAINDSGQITGEGLNPSGHLHAFVLTPVPAATLAVSAPATATTGTAFSVSVTAKDGNGGTVPSYTGTVHFTSTDASAALPADYTFQAADNGTKAFSATLNTAGNNTLTATDTVTGSITGISGNIATSAPAPTATADLAIKKKGAMKVKSGSNLNYAISVTNKGPQSAGGVAVTDNMPGGVTFVSATPSQGTCARQTAGTISCNLGTIAPAGFASINVVVTVTTTAGSTVSNTATVTANVNDPVSSNNSATLTTSVIR